MPYVSSAAASAGHDRTEAEQQAAQRPQAGAAPGQEDCVFCRILGSGEPDDVTYVVWRGRRAFAVLNAFPYASGHLMVMPTRHVAELEDIAGDEADELWGALSDAIRALKASYRPDGVNVGANLGRAAGAGVPGHFHFHAVPRWVGDTNFTTAVAETRVLPESLPDTWRRLRTAWPQA
ncbi:MAG TPA: HIT domain-containing protein [Acidimicrobiales bacterium]|jgi:ATP adenylyltransferase|nr:HIT domain-containing protein [Acidimicrobiales bacterium]